MIPMMLRDNMYQLPLSIATSRYYSGVKLVGWNVIWVLDSFCWIWSYSYSWVAKLTVPINIVCCIQTLSSSLYCIYENLELKYSTPPVMSKLNSNMIQNIVHLNWKNKIVECLRRFNIWYTCSYCSTRTYGMTTCGGDTKAISWIVSFM